MHTCRDKLQCPQCLYTWREFIQMSSFQKSIKAIKDTATLKTETFSYINQVMTGCPCPKCGLVIWKDGGWNHMVCQKWKHEFCWLCLGFYPNYSHKETTFCPIRKIITFTLTLLTLISGDYKLCSYFYYWHLLHSVIYTCILYFFLYLILPNVMFFLLLSSFPLLYLSTAATLNKRSNSWLRIWGFIWLWVWLGYGYLQYRIWKSIFWSERYYFVFKVVMIEVTVVMAVGVMLVLFKLFGRVIYEGARVIVRWVCRWRRRLGRAGYWWRRVGRGCRVWRKRKIE